MKKITYSASTPIVKMPQTHNVGEWKRFFEQLRKVDYFAPLFALYYCEALLCDKEVSDIPNVYDELYHDISIELCSDDRYPAYKAAFDVGFVAEGISMLIGAASTKGEYQEDFLAIVDTILKDYRCLDFLADETIEMAKHLVGAAPAKCSEENAADASVEANTHCWNEVFLEAILTDPGAPASIIGYYLGAKTGQCCSIFCPLGCNQYESLGKSMAQDAEVFNAAKAVGVVACGIETYVSAALDNDSNWNAHYPGIKFILGNPSLRCFVPARNLYMTERLVGIDAIKASDDDDWGRYYDFVKGEFKDEYRGY